LLGLLGIDADPIKSKEHIFISNILTSYWQRGENLDLEPLTRAIQKPLFNKIGIMDLETFYPEKERMDLALLFNNLLASPAFKLWMDGEAFAVNSFLYSATGKPKLSVFLHRPSLRCRTYVFCFTVIQPGAGRGAHASGNFKLESFTLF
jgi:hypothetical protein